MIRPSMRRHLGGLLVAAAVFGALALLVVGGIRERWAARRAFPEVQGTVVVPGLSTAVSIFRDEHGIAHAEARSRSDALFALGFIHAQDRLAQMVWLLRLARGRTAEVIGEAGLPADRLARALNLSGAAETDLSRLSTDARAALESYSAGVNAGIDQIRTREVAAPIAMQRLEIPLEPWRPSDSLAVLKGRFGRYLFVSTVAVYDPASAGPYTESSPLRAAPAAGVEEVTGATYGPLKAECDRIVRAALGDAATTVRPTYIVGPGDDTDRFTYWVERMALGGEVLGPPEPSSELQWVDVRDLCPWIIELVEQDKPGIFNAAGPAVPVNWEQVLRELARGSDKPANLRWATREVLELGAIHASPP